MEIKYPKEIASVIRKQTLSVNAELIKPEEGDSPLKFYDERFSRFPFTIINVDKKFANANISLKEMPNIFRRSEKAYDAEMEREINPASNEGNGQNEQNEQNGQKISSAYTVKISSGMFKGKTPAQVLLENPNNMKGLKNQFDFLKKNCEKYPKNKTQMVAIKEAKELYAAGKLVNQEVKSQSEEFVIYNSGFRPLKRKTRQDGMSFVYSIKIYWVFGQQYPLNIEILNYYAPVTSDDKGLLNVQFAKRDVNSVIKNTMKLTAAEWENIMYIMKTNMRAYENEVGPMLRKQAADASFENYQKATGQSQNVQNNQPFA